MNEGHTPVAMIHTAMAVTTITRCISVLAMLRRNSTAIVRVKRTKCIPGKSHWTSLPRKEQLGGLS